MRQSITRFFIQQGSSQDLRVSDQDAWYVVRKVWPDASSARSRCELETKCQTKTEALNLAEIYNAPEESISALSEWSGIGVSTLLKAMQQGRLKARKSGKTWLSTRRAVMEFKESAVLKPRGG